jgi:hypothetical protein
MPSSFQLDIGASRALAPSEIAACDESKLRGRIKQVGFPVLKRLNDCKVQASSVPPATFNYISGLLV